MGQQQLLLLVLGIVIVGLAVVAGINAFEENQERSTKDAMVNEGMRIATDIKAHRLEPSQYGGGGGDTWPANLEAIGTTSSTPWGTLVYTDPGGGSASTADAKLELQPNGIDEHAIINIPASGQPELANSGQWQSGASSSN